MAVSQTIQEKMLEEAYSATPNYDVDYNAAPFEKVNSDYQKDLNEFDATFGNMVGDTDEYYKDLIDKNQQWADERAQIQQEQTDFAIEQIKQQKEQAQKDYLKEQSGAYVDYKKQSSKYGTEAEKLAGAGLTDTGYAESSQVSMYNTYQNRVAMARDALERAKLQYDNSIKEAMLANNAALAQIYADAYIKQAELALEGFQYKNQLIFDLASKKTEIKNTYYSRWQDALQQINTENALKEDIRQYNETMKWNTEQNELDRQHDEHLKELQHDYDKKLAEIENNYAKERAEIEQNYKLEYLDASTKKEKEILDKQHQNDMKKLEQQLANSKALLDKELANEKAKIKYQYDLEHQTVGYVGGTPIKLTTGNKLSTSKPTTYKQYREEQLAKQKTFSGTTYDSAVSYLKSSGVPSSYRAGLMTTSEWSRRKNADSSSAHVKNYSSYSAYLQAYVNYGVQSYGK